MSTCARCETPMARWRRYPDPDVCDPAGQRALLTWAGFGPEAEVCAPCLIRLDVEKPETWRQEAFQANRRVS